MLKKYIRKIKKYFIKKAAARKRQVILNKNIELSNIHNGQRCFIIGTGPSINTQDLKLLQNENCIAMSQLYNHPDYNIIDPKYHIFSGVKIHSYLFSENVAVQYYQEVDSKIKEKTTLLINYPDFNFIQENKLLKNKKIHYFSCDKHYKKLLKEAINYPKSFYESQCVSVMAIQNAIAMGFKEIYLLGLDHDWILRMKDKIQANFYDSKQSVFGKNGVVENWHVCDWRAVFKAQYILWDEYEHLKSYIKQNNIQIYNATNGGILEVFPRVKYETLFNVELSQIKKVF